MPVTNYHTLNGELLGETGPGGRRFYGKDALGSVVATYDQNGTLENTYRYKPYGGLLSKTGSAPDPRFMWNGTSAYSTIGDSLPIQFAGLSYSPQSSTWLNTGAIGAIFASPQYSGGRPTTIAYRVAISTLASTSAPSPYPCPGDYTNKAPYPSEECSCSSGRLVKTHRSTHGPVKDRSCGVLGFNIGFSGGMVVVTVSAGGAFSTTCTEVTNCRATHYVTWRCTCHGCQCGSKDAICRWEKATEARCMQLVTETKWKFGKYEFVTDYRVKSYTSSPDCPDYEKSNDGLMGWLCNLVCNVLKLVDCRGHKC